jgi:DNA-directed RNA polymerase subunit F
MVKKPISERYISIPEVKDIMIEVKDKLQDLDSDFETLQEYTLIYAKTFAKVESDIAKKIIDMLMSEYNVKEEIAVQVANLNPHYIYELQVIFEKDPELKFLDSDQLQEMIYKINDIRDK